MEQDKTTDVNKHVRLLLRRKWLWIIPTIIFSIGAAFHAAYTPNVYESRCVLIIEESEVLSDVMREDYHADSGGNSLSRHVRERMLSWEPVINVIKTLGLDREMPEDDLGALERLYHSIAQNTEVTTTDENDLVEISYRGTNPEMNFRIVDGLVSNFMKQSLESLRVDADETVKFIDEDGKRLKRNLDESEKRLHKFEEEHFDELPGNQNSNLSQLKDAENEHAAIGREIAAVHEEISFLEDRKKEENKAVRGNGAPMLGIKINDLNTRISNLEIELEMLRAKYFDTHPEIVLRQKELASLKETLEIESEKVVSEEGKIVYNPARYESLIAKEIDLQLELESLKSRRKGMKSMIASLSESVKSVQNYNQEFYELQRDYDLNKQLYEQRLLQKSKAVLMKEISLDSKTSPFNLVEPPRISYEPIIATKVKIMAMGFILGIGLGIGLIFGLEQIDQRFKSMDEVQEYLQIPALGIIPTILTKMDIKRKIRKRIILSGILAAFIIAATTVCFVVEPVKDTVSSNVIDGWSKTNELIKGRGD